MDVDHTSYNNIKNGVLSVVFFAGKMWRQKGVPLACGACTVKSLMRDVTSVYISAPPHKEVKVNHALISTEEGATVHFL